MNHLAHLFLAGTEPDFLVGNLMGDFVKGAIGQEWELPFREGIWMHRQVDSFTDAHPQTLESRNLFEGAMRRYAGIIVDLSYDHYLARHWTLYATESIEKFTLRVYRDLENRAPTLPEKLRQFLPHMSSRNLLAGYADLDVLSRVLTGISGRLRRENPLCVAIDDVRRHYNELEAHFHSFFPQLILHVESLRGRLSCPRYAWDPLWLGRKQR